MKEIVGVRFKALENILFSPGDIDARGEPCYCETVRGVECGEVVIANRQIDDDQISSPLKPIIRIATPADMKTVERNKEREKEAFAVCEEKIAFRKLKMNLVDVECTFNNNKLLFYFTAENVWTSVAGQGPCRSIPHTYQPRRKESERGKDTGRPWNMRKRILCRLWATSSLYP